MVGWRKLRKLRKEGKKERSLCGEKYFFLSLSNFLEPKYIIFFFFFQGKNGAIANYEIIQLS